MSRFIKRYAFFATLFLGLVCWLPAGAQDSTETILPDTPLTVTVEAGGGVDLVYEAPDTQLITVTARSLDGEVDTLLELYDADGDMLTDNDDTLTSLPDLSSTDSAIVGFVLPNPGTYTIHITSFGAVDSGDVEVTLTVTGAATPVIQAITEVETANKVLFTTEPLKVYLGGDAPVDLLYSIDSPQTISVYSNSLDSNAEELDSVLEILDSDGNSLVENDDLNDESYDAGIEDFALSDAGTYTIRVRTFDSIQMGGVEITLVSGEGADLPVENTACESPTLNLGDTLEGSVTGDSGTEFIFCGTAGQVVTITAIATDPPSLTQDLYMTLYDANGDEVASDDDSASLNQLDPSIQSLELPSDGAYRVEITSIDNLAGDFTITLEEG